MNNLLLCLAIVIVFSLLTLTKKLFGKAGIIGFMGIATIIANIATCKSVTLLGMGAALGNVMFASNFLSTDILTECYGKKEAKKGVFFAIFSIVTFCLCTQLMLLFTPNEFDIAQDSMRTLFGLMPRITLASVSMFALSNIADVRLYDWLRVKAKGRNMWLRNNVSTMLCNGLENFAFYAIAFLGVMGIDQIIQAAMSATIIEILIAICDTPFLYLATRKERKSNKAIA